MMKHRPYWRFGAMMALSFVAMYGLMYAMVNAMPNVYLNVNQAYMAGLMAAPMAIIELFLMRAMYPDARKNAVMVAASAVAMLLCWLAIRSQAGVNDRQFLRSMIPHHAGAILMCRQAAIVDAEIRRLCAEITEGQQREIAEMKAVLQRLR